MSELIFSLLTSCWRFLIAEVLRLIPGRIQTHAIPRPWIFSARKSELEAAFDCLDTEHGSSEKKWLHIRRAAFALDSLNIPHPSEDSNPDNWRSFLAQIVDAATHRDVERAASAPVYGANVARLIMQDENTDKAMARFHDHRISVGRFDSDWVNVAILHRLHQAGENRADEFMDLALSLCTDDEDIMGTEEMHRELGIETEWWDELPNLSG